MKIETPWERAKKKTRSQRQEERLGKKGKPQINSGRTSWRSKRDAILYNRMLVEARTTDKSDTISVSRREWKTIRRQAEETPPGLLPGMHLEWSDLRLLVIDERDADEFFNYMEVLEERIKELVGPKITDHD